jgi:hypothetical protein
VRPLVAFRRLHGVKEVEVVRGAMFFGWPREIGKLFWAEDAGRVLLDGDHPRFMSHCFSVSSSPGTHHRSFQALLIGARFTKPIWRDITLRNTIATCKKTKSVLNTFLQSNRTDLPACIEKEQFLHRAIGFVSVRRHKTHGAGFGGGAGGSTGAGGGVFATDT